MRDLTIKDLKSVVEKLPDDMLVVIPVVDEEDVNQIYGFRRVRTAGILVCNEDEDALCLNGATPGIDISDQVTFSGRDVGVKEVFNNWRKQND